MSDLKINRGVELVLNGGKKSKKETFRVVFDKTISFLRREINFYFKISLDIRKK